jgi:hypothetical protein
LGCAVAVGNRYITEAFAFELNQVENEEFRAH